MSGNDLPVTVAVHPHVGNAERSLELLSFNLGPCGHTIARHGCVAVRAHLQIIFVVSPDDRFLGGHAYLAHYCRLIDTDADRRRDHDVVRVNAIERVNINSSFGLGEFFFELLDLFFSVVH